MATGENFKASVIGELDDGTGIVFDFGYTDNVSGSVHLDMAIAAGNFQTLVQATLVQALPADYTFKRYRFACVAGVHAGEIGYVEVTPAVHGDLSVVNRYPNELAIAVKRNTGYASRRDRGRIFLGPVSASLADNANVNKCVPDAAPLVAVANLLKSNLTSGGVVLKPVILSSAGTYSGNLVSKVGVADVLVHHKSRRPRTGA